MSVGSACQVLKSRMPEDVVLTVLKEMRVEAREFREETRGSFGTVFHRLNLVEARLGDVESRLTSLGARVPAVRSGGRLAPLRVSGSPPLPCSPVGPRCLKAGERRRRR